MKKEGYIKKTDEYFIETKSGKKVPVRDLQLEVLSIMKEIDRVCRKNDIKYFLIAGSSLGICNYGGFIPWDDDMDIAVDIEDYPRLIQALQKDLKKDFYFDCYETDKRYNTIAGPWMKVRKRGTYIEEVNFLLKNRCKQGNGIFVDIIPYGGVCENKWIDELERIIVRINMLFIVLLDNLHINPIVYPLKEYEFENNKFYSYHNIEKVMKEWYGPNCLKKWNGKEWEETLPVEKRIAKHTKDLNLKGENKENS